ncbi:MAG: ATP-binding protein [Spirochaetaceae bacterium]|jgi:predicted AAA+ superfamily ATPase|nr:ATP-binding protein [Spirochaetaceae bacterium]
MNMSKTMCDEALSCLLGLSVFSGLRTNPLMKAFEKLLLEAAKNQNEPLNLIKAWADFTSVYIKENQCNSFYMKLLELILSDENTFTLSAERGEFKEKSLLASLTRSDLRRLSIIGDFDIPMLALSIADILWEAGCKDCAKLIEEGVQSLGELKADNETIESGVFPYVMLETQNPASFAAFVRENGAGSLSKHHFFHWKTEAGLLPALNPDTISLGNLSGYEDQRQIVVNNTLRFLEGRGGNNVLLYGDRGTGKSATVKAIAHNFAPRGLRLVEVRKQDIDELPEILGFLSRRGLYFVLFIDDLSFESQNDSFNTTKALLEGGIETKPENVVIYATSNRRHLVKEKSQDRPDGAAAAASVASGDMRAFDTMQEQLSLADRFGITVVFASPNQNEFLKIAEFLAQERGLLGKKQEKADAERLKKFRDNALKWERWFNGRSPRTARQYIDWLSGGENFPWE